MFLMPLSIISIFYEPVSWVTWHRLLRRTLVLKNIRQQGKEAIGKELVLLMIKIRTYKSATQGTVKIDLQYGSKNVFQEQ